MSGAATTTRGVGGRVGAPAGSFPLDVAALAALLGLAFVGLFYRWLFKQGQLSVLYVEDWGHALAIPLISGFMVWKQRGVVSRTPITRFWPGLAPMLLGVACYLFFVVGVPNHMMQGFSILLTLLGASLLLLGPLMMRHLFLPLAYLGFAVTLAERIMIEVTFQLKLVASYGAWVLLSATGPMVGYSVQRDGNLLNMVRLDGSVFEMNVADACSGMRMVVAFVALGGAVALLGARRWWQRTAIMLLTVPVAVLMNVLRVAVLGWLGYFDENLAGGEAHTLIGTILLLPSLLFFMFLVWALERVVVEGDGDAANSAKGAKGAKGAKTTAKAKGKSKGKSADGPRRVLGPAPAGSGLAGLRAALVSPAFVVVLLGLTTTAAGMGAAVSYFRLYLSKLPIQPADGRTLTSLPTETLRWRRLGQDHVESAEVQKTLGTENYVTRNYVLRSTEGTARPTVVTLHAAYYTGTIDTVPHVPERCFVGGGMEIGEGSQTLDLGLDSTRWMLDPVVETEAGLEGLRGRVWTTNLFDEDGDRIGRVRLPVDADKIRVRVTTFLAPGQGKVFAGYFFIANGGTTASAEGVRLLAFRLEDDYAYYLKVQFTSSTVESAEELRDAAKSLMEDLLGDVMRCTPDWVEVLRGTYPEGNPRARGGSAGGAGAPPAGG